MAMIRVLDTLSSYMDNYFQSTKAKVIVLKHNVNSHQRLLVICNIVFLQRYLYQAEVR